MTERFERSRELDAELGGWGRFLDPTAAPARIGVEAPIRGDLIRSELDRTQLDLITIDARRQVISRTPAHIARTPTPLHIIVVHLEGRSILTPADGRGPVVYEPGYMALGTSQVPYRWEFEGPVRLLMLRVPMTAVDVAPTDLVPLLGRPFPADSGLAGLVVPFAEEVLSQPSLLAGQSRARVLHDIVSLFTTVLVGQLESSADRDRSTPAFLRVAQYITDHLGDSLDLRTIADANGMSTRLVQLLFQERGTSATEWIRLRRVESARRALADPALAEQSVSQIATDHGFADHAHFTRTFRAAFGETPTSWRGRALHRAAVRTDTD